MKKIQIISLFPEMFDKVLHSSMMLKASNQKIVEFNYIQLRDFGIGPRKQVDDIPYGGGDGMLLKPEPLFEAVEFAKRQDNSAKVLLMTPRGKVWNQKMARDLAELESGLIVICGRYEGYDERVVSIVDSQISLGKFVLTGGEIPAMAIIDSVVRLIPGVLGGMTSAIYESFSNRTTVEYPQYTRPEEFRGMKVPGVLLSGNHAEIIKWRQQD